MSIDDAIKETFDAITALKMEGVELKAENAELKADNARVNAENELLRQRVTIAEGNLYTDDLADAARDRERELDFAKSEAWQDRGARG